MSSAPHLLEQAQRVLDGDSAHRNRVAGWIARSALESLVDTILEDCGSAVPRASMRSKLTVLQVATADEPAISARAGYAWSELSRACHHHAYDLTPPASEVQHLLDLVASLVPATATPTRSDRAVGA